MAKISNCVQAVLICGVVGVGSLAGAQDVRPHYSLYGTPGLVEMPSAHVAPDGEASVSVNGFGLQQRVGLTFQLAPRITGTFRYAHFDHVRGPGTADTYDRSFDFQYNVVREGPWLPSVSVGLRDFAGTGLLTSEYVVATKTVSPDIRLTGGLGWGRLGTRNGFTNPLGVLASGFETRPNNDFGLGGTPSFSQYFRGDAALFGGVEWRLTPKFTLVGEYSSDAYVRETNNGNLDPQSPFNFGLTWTPSESSQISAYSLFGTDIGLSFTHVFNPVNRPNVSGLDPAPLPVRVRGAGATPMVLGPQSSESLQTTLTQAMAADGIELQAIEFAGTEVRVRYENSKYRSEAQAMGHVVRILSFLLPDHYESFVLEPTDRGIALSSTRLQRRDVERFSQSVGGTRGIYDSAEFGPARSADTLTTVQTDQSAFEWGVRPYSDLTLFDPTNPATFDVGIEAVARYEFSPAFVLSGAVRDRLWTNRDGKASGSGSVLPHVRSDIGRYGQTGSLALSNLAAAWYGIPGDNLYSRLTVGYLEQMFGGISAELLWKRTDSPFALGAELNYVAQRDFDMGFGFQDYDVLTGHLSAYWKMDNGFHVQLDGGRYLAGDWGATLSVDREFANGWRLGAYATLTDVPFADFGEGSFDKGIRVTVPLDWTSGQPNRTAPSTTLNSLSRDGGARLAVEGRLYEVVRKGHFDNYENSWGRFWK